MKIVQLTGQADSPHQDRFVLAASSLRLMIEMCVCIIERVSTHPFDSTSSCLSRAVVMRCVDNSWLKKMPEVWFVPSSIALAVHPLFWYL